MNHFLHILKIESQGCSLESSAKCLPIVRIAFTKFLPQECCLNSRLHPYCSVNFLLVEILAHFRILGLKVFAWLLHSTKCLWSQLAFSQIRNNPIKICRSVVITLDRTLFLFIFSDPNLPLLHCKSDGKPGINVAANFMRCGRNLWADVYHMISFCLFVSS